MESSDDIRELLEKIHDVHREHLEEYRRVTQRSLEMQQRAVDRQEQVSRIYKIALAIGGLLVLGIILVILYVLSLL